jgi:hypothetical protein
MKTRTLKDWSAIDKHIKIKDVLKEQIKHIMEDEVYNDPFISWISIGQIQWGNGYHFKFLPGSLKKGLNFHMGFRNGKPASEQTRRRHFNICGWDPGMYPNDYERSIKTWINDHVIKKILSKKGWENIAPLFAPGFYDPKTLSLDPNSKRTISGYFFALEDSKVTKRQTEFIKSRWRAPKQKHIPLQFEYAKPAMKKHIREQIKSGEDKIDFKERLRESTYFDSINPRSAIPKSYLEIIDSMFDDDDD